MTVYLFNNYKVLTQQTDSFPFDMNTMDRDYAAVTLTRDSSKKHYVVSSIGYSFNETCNISHTVPLGAGSISNGVLTAIGTPDNSVRSGDPNNVNKTHEGTIASDGNCNCFYINDGSAAAYVGDPYTPNTNYYSLNAWFNYTKSAFAVTLGNNPVNVNSNQEVRLSVNPTQQSCPVQYSVSGGTLYYKHENASGYTAIAYSGSTAIIPAGTLTAPGKYSVYVTATADDGTTAQSPVITFTVIQPQISISCANYGKRYIKTVVTVKSDSDLSTQYTISSINVYYKKTSDSGYSVQSFSGNGSTAQTVLLDIYSQSTGIFDCYAVITSNGMVSAASNVDNFEKPIPDVGLSLSNAAAVRSIPIVIKSNNVSGIDEEYKIKSIVVYYKLLSASSYNSQSFSGNNNQSQTVSLNMASAAIGDYTTYAAVTMDDGTVDATNSATFSKPAPSVTIDQAGGYLNPAKANVISFTAGYVDADSQYAIVSGTLFYKLASASEYTSIAFTGKSASIPAGSLSSGQSYNIYGTVTFDDGNTGSSTVSTYSTVDAAPGVTPLYPNNAVVYKSVEFDWQYNNSYGNDQYAYDLQYSSDQSTWTDIVVKSVTSSTTYAAEISASGKLYWRVRCYNLDNVVSDWSNAIPFVNNLPPDPPVITSVTGTGRIIVNWSSANQIAYELIVGDYSTGIVPSTNHSRLVNKYLTNGTYIIKLRIFNAYGKASTYATYTRNQSLNVTAPIATVTQMDGYNEVTIEKGDFDHFYILRDGIVIARSGSGVYKDYYCAGINEYTIRGVMTDDSFSDIKVTANYSCKGAEVIDPDNNSIINLAYRYNSPDQISLKYSVEHSRVLFFGKSKPSDYAGTVETREWSVGCADQLKVNHLYYYRNRDNDSGWVKTWDLSKISNYQGIKEYQYSLYETDHSEAIDYDLPS